MGRLLGNPGGPPLPRLHSLQQEPDGSEAGCVGRAGPDLVPSAAGITLTAGIALAASSTRPPPPLLAAAGRAEAALEDADAAVELASAALSGAAPSSPPPDLLRLAAKAHHRRAEALLARGRPVQAVQAYLMMPMAGVFFLGVLWRRTTAAGVFGIERTIAAPPSPAESPAMRFPAAMERKVAALNRASGGRSGAM